MSSCSACRNCIAPSRAPYRARVLRESGDAWTISINPRRTADVFSTNARDRVLSDGADAGSGAGRWSHHSIRGRQFRRKCGESIGDGADAERLDWGASFAWMGGGVFGFEGDIGYSPDFYGKTDLGGSSVLSLMGNVLLGVPFGGQQGFGVRPYALVGIGALRSDLESFADLIGSTTLKWPGTSGAAFWCFSARMSAFAATFAISGRSARWTSVPSRSKTPMPSITPEARLGLVLRF